MTCIRFNSTTVNVSKLPRWAMVAYAARCVRRALPVYAGWGGAKSDAIALVSKAVETAESLAAKGRASASEIEEAQQIANRALEVSDRLRHINILENEVASSAYHAVLAAILAAMGGDAHILEMVQQVVKEAGAVIFIYLKNVAVLQDDFNAIAEATRRDIWTNDTPVTPEMFGEMWPGGAPPWWPQIESEPKSDNCLIINYEKIIERVIRKLQDDPDLLYRISPEQFEIMIAELVEQAGFNVERTGAINKSDGGIDFIAVPKSPRNCPFLIGGQVKHHNRPNKNSGTRDVNELLVWKDHEFHLGLLVTNTAFTSEARHKVEAYGKYFIKLRDGTHVRNWLRGNFEGMLGELPKRIQLTSRTWIDVPSGTQGSSVKFWPKLDDEGGEG